MNLIVYYIILYYIILYIEFLKNIISPTDIYIRSTNYDRTIQSVAALMTTLVPSLLTKIAMKNHKLTINVQPKDEDEVMHGIGSRITSNKHGNGIYICIYIYIIE